MIVKNIGNEAILSITNKIFRKLPENPSDVFEIPFFDFESIFSAFLKLSFLTSKIVK